MTEIGNKWPLTKVTIPRKNALERGKPVHHPLKGGQDQRVKDKSVAREPERLWKKGTLIDFYI